MPDFIVEVVRASADMPDAVAAHNDLWLASQAATHALRNEMLDPNQRTPVEPAASNALISLYIESDPDLDKLVREQMANQMEPGVGGYIRWLGRRFKRRP